MGEEELREGAGRPVGQRPAGWPTTITKLRVDNYLSTTDAAHLIGVTRNTLNRYELGQCKIPVKKLDKILGVYHKLAISSKGESTMHFGMRSLSDSPAKNRIALQKQTEKFAELIEDYRFDDNGMDLTERLEVKRLQRDAERRAL
mgnify:FL=1|jgi:transcriptional regulator with XRE-family HTH domain